MTTSTPRLVQPHKLVALLVLLLSSVSWSAGCTLEDLDSLPTALPDDDDAGDDDDDDDDTVDDDDDSAGDDDSVGDDDSASDDDSPGDDDPPPGSNDVVTAWLVEQMDLTAQGVGTSHVSALATFEAGAVDPGFGNPLDTAGLPLPGVGLHPERLDDLLAQSDGGTEGCAAISSQDPWTTPDRSDLVGSPVEFFATGQTSLELIQSTNDAPYVVSQEGTVSAGPWSLRVPGGPTWPASTLEAILQSPLAPTVEFPDPGGMLGVPYVNVRWSGAQNESSSVEIVVVRYHSDFDPIEWTGVRCVADDDGLLQIDVSALVPNINGTPVITVSRAQWITEPGDAESGTPRIHSGFIRAVRFEKDGVAP